MQAFERAEIELRRRAHGKLHQEVLRTPTPSMGLEVLPAGARRRRTPRWTVARAAR